MDVNKNKYCTVYPQKLLLEAQQNPEAPAISAPDKNSLSYEELLGQINNVGTFLNYKACKKNTVIAVVLPNGPEMAVCFLGVSAYAICAPLNPNYSKQDFIFYLSDLKPEIIIADQSASSALNEAAGELNIEIVVINKHENETVGKFYFKSYERIENNGVVEVNSEEDVAIILHTSGSTSRPKMVPLTHKNILVNAKNIGASLNLSASDISLNIMPLFHIHGLIGVLLATVMTGGHVICTSGLKQTEDFFKWLKVYKPTWYSAVPTMHQTILKHADRLEDKNIQHSLRFIRSSSSSLPHKVFDELETLFKVPVIQAYGMTEAAHQIAANPLPPGLRKNGSVGLPTNTEIAILDADNNILPANEVGEIAVKGSNITLGYLNNDKANQDGFLKGWFRTGDQGYIDSQGYLYLSGRLKEIINRGGEKVMPAEIDQVLLQHVSVEQAITFAVKHPTLGEDIIAGVVLKELENTSPKELRKFLIERLAGFKVPTKILILAEIPKTASGKLKRLDLAELLKKELEDYYYPPLNPIEYKIIDIWQVILGKQKIGRLDNFFMLGGDSLSAIRMLKAIEAHFNLTLPLPILFEEPSVAELANWLTNQLLSEIENMPEGI